MLLLSSFYIPDNWQPERLNNFPSLSQVLRHGTERRTEATDPRAHVPNYLIIFLLHSFSYFNLSIVLADICLWHIQNIYIHKAHTSFSDQAVLKNSLTSKRHDKRIPANWKPSSRTTTRTQVLSLSHSGLSVLPPLMVPTSCNSKLLRQQITSR